MRKVTVALCAALTLGMTTGAFASGDPAAGKSKASKCAMCHGPNGEGVGTNPPLAGKTASYLVEQLQNYQAGKRQNKQMEMMAKVLKPADMADIAAYFASLK